MKKFISIIIILLFPIVAMATNQTVPWWYSTTTQSVWTYPNINLNVGIGTSSPYAKLSVVGEIVSSFLTATSTVATSSIAYDTSILGRLKVAQTGTDAKIIGETTGNARGVSALDIQGSRSAVTEVASGNYSAAVGGRNTASGQFNSAFGYQNTSLLDSTSAFGFGNTASDDFATAFGYSNISSGQNSSSFGNGNNVSGLGSSAYGYANTVSGTNATAIGGGITNNINSSLQFGPSDTAKVTVLSTGNVGIGTTSPYAKLSVVGETVSTNFTATSSTASIFPYASTTALSATSLCFSTDCITSWGSIGTPYPFSLAGNATSTLTQFNGGLTAYASTTIGSGNQSTGLTVNGGATTTQSAYFGTTMGIGTTTMQAVLNIGPDSTAATGGMQFGSDTNLYRSAANTLKTDDDFHVENQTATTTVAVSTKAASKGGVIVLEDIDGAGCTEVSALNGVLTAKIVTCPVGI